MKRMDSLQAVCQGDSESDHLENKFSEWLASDSPAPKGIILFSECVVFMDQFMTIYVQDKNNSIAPKLLRQ